MQTVGNAHRVRATVSPVLAAAVVAVLAANSHAASLWWDTTATSGLQAGNGVWTAAGGTNWATSNSPGAVAPGPWVAGSDANFTVNGASAITLDGDVEAASMTVTVFAAPTLSADTSNGDDSLILGAGGITHTGNSLLTINAPLTLGANQAWNVTNSNGVRVNSAIGQSTPGTTLTKTGAGRVVLTGANTYSGATTISDGQFEIGDGGATGSLASSAINLNGGKLIFNSSGNHTYAGNVTGAAVTTSWVDKTGTGTLTLTGTNAFNGGASVQVQGGLNVVSGKLVSTGTTTAGYGIFVGGRAGNSGIMSIEGSVSGSVFRVGGATTSAGGVYQSAGTHAMSSQFNIGQSGYGFYHLSGGSIQTPANSYITIGSAANASGVFYQSGNASTTSVQDLRVANAGEVGIVRVSGGTMQFAGATLGMSTNKRAEMTLEGDSVTTFAWDIAVGNASGVNAVFNLNDQAVAQTSTNRGVATGSTGGVRQVNLDGGTLRYTGTGTFSTLIAASTAYSVFVHDDGAVFDVTQSSGRSTVAQPLLAPTGDGVVNTVGQTVPIASGGSGYVGAPVVTITGAPGATAVANMVDDGTGKGTFKVASITITSPGIGAVDPTFTFGDVAGATPALPVALTTAANVSGGLVKKGPGTLDLTAANTYTGETRIEQGTIRLLSSGNIASSVVNVAAGATFDATPLAGGTTVKGLAGSGTVRGKSANSLTVSASLAPGNSTGLLTVSEGNLLIGDDAVYSYEIASLLDTDRIKLTNAASTLAFAGDWTLALSKLAAVDPEGAEFVLFEYTSNANDSLALGNWSINYGTTGWSGGTIAVDSATNTVVLSGLTAIPEPTSLALLGLGALGLRRRRGR